MKKAAKRILKILKRVFITLFLTVYILVALLNLSTVQTTLGHLASSFFSKAWGAHVEIGGISLNIFNHLTVYDVLLKDPAGDTVAQAEKIKCSFSGFPLGNGLNVRKVYVQNTIFNLRKDEKGLNLAFIINYFKSDKKKEKKKSVFPIRIKQLELDNVSFSLSMLSTDTTSKKKTPENGVDVKDMAFSKINADVRDISILGDSIHALFKQFSTVEKSGFTVEQIAMEATVSSSAIKVQEAHVKTKNSELFFDASIHYSGWNMMKYFIDSVQMKAKVKEGSYACMGDGGVWAATSPLFGMRTKVNVELDFEGTVDDMRSDFKLSFGKETFINGKASLKGLPKINETIIDAEIESLTTTVNDVNNFKFPKIKLPDMLAEMGYVGLSASFKGKIKDFDVTANVLSGIGNVNTKAKVSFNEKLKDYQYSGNVILTDLRPASVIKFDKLSRADLNITFSGQGTSLKNLKAHVEGGGYNIVFENHTYDSLLFDITASNQIFKGDLHLADNSKMGLDFEGSVNLSNIKVPECNFTADIRDINLTKLNLFKTKDSNTIISVKIDADFRGLALDDLKGKLFINDLKYTEGVKSVSIKELFLDIKDTNNEKGIFIRSDIFNFDMLGTFRFKDFNVLASRFMSNYVPQYFNRSSAFSPEGIQENQYYKFDLVLFDTRELCSVFVPSLKVSDSTHLFGEYKLDEGIIFNLASDSVKLNSIKLNNIRMKSEMADSNFYHINFELDNIIIGSLTYFENLIGDINSRSDLLELHLLWDNEKDTALNKGQINLYAHTEPFIINASFRDSRMWVNGEEWRIDQQGLILYSETDINIGDLIIKTDDQSIKINSEISDDGADELTVDFKQFKIEQFNSILDNMGMHSSGVINGKAEINGIKKVPHFKSDLTINNLSVNYEKLGDATIKAAWDTELERVSMDLKILYKGNIGTSQPIALSGYFYPLRKKDNYDIEVAFQNFKLKTIAGYLRSFSSRLEGNLSGNLSVKGDLKTPLIKGELAVDYGKIRIDFLNTTYDFADKIEINETSINLVNFNLIDSLANQANITGKITHNGFKNFAFDLSVKSSDFIFMNTPRKVNSLYYGSVAADIDADISGNMDRMVITANARTSRGTNLTIPVTGKATVSDRQFINFVVKDSINPDSVFTRERVKKKAMEMVMNIHLEVTPDARVNIPLDYTQIKGDLSATGKGNLVIAINTKTSAFNIYGTYTVEKGSFQMQLLDLLDKTFELEKGGTLVWAGNPVGATMNISAVYQTKASLQSLFPDNAGSSMNQKVTVQSVINLDGQLMNPIINFDIRLPYSDPTTEELVFSAIDRNDQTQMSQQTIYLLLMNSFYSEQGGLSSVGKVSGYEMLGSMLSSFIPYVDVGLSYNDQTQAADVTVAKDIGAFHIDLTGSSAGNNPQSNAQGSVTGNISYRLNDRIQFYMFNRSNADDITKDNTGYTQGLGVSYQRDFDLIMEILKRKTAEEKAKEKELKNRAKDEKERERKAQKDEEAREKAARKERERIRKAKKKAGNSSPTPIPIEKPDTTK